MRGVDLAVAPGEVVAVLGPPGAGKSTLLQVLATATRPDTGCVYVAGHLIAAWPGRRPASLAVRRAIGYLGEDPPPLPELTGWEAGRFWGELHGLHPTEVDRRLAELLAWAGLDPVARRPLAEWGYAERRRLGWVLALLHRPRVLILDNPGRGQPPQWRQALAQALARHAVAGGAAVLALDVPPGSGLAPVAVAGRDLAAPELAACHRLLTMDGGKLA